MNTAAKILTYGFLLALGVLSYSVLALALSSPSYFHIASVVWISILVAIGVVTGRRFWHGLSEAIGVLVVGLIVFFAILLEIAATGSSPTSLSEVFSGAGEMMVYSLWFWLSFVGGAALGGIHSNRRKSDNKPKTDPQ